MKVTSNPPHRGGSSGGRSLFLAILGIAIATGCGTRHAPRALELTTWSIAAMDPATGDVGVAVASCVPNAHVDAIAALVPGVGVAVTQAYWELGNRNRVYAALLEGLPAEAVIGRVADAALDSGLATRQYGVVTLTNEAIRIAGFTGGAAPDWSGIRHDLGMAVTVQGNTLVGEAVVADALAAFLDEDPSGTNSLPDRLMRALESGSAAGGDVRCNRGGIDSTATTAAVLVARGNDPPYAARDIMLTDQGTDAAPWLAISEAGPLDGPNPLIELRRRYDLWRSSVD